MNLKGYKRKRPWPTSRYPGLVWRNWGMPRESSIVTDGLWFEIRNLDFTDPKECTPLGRYLRCVWAERNEKATSTHQTKEINMKWTRKSLLPRFRPYLPIPKFAKRRSTFSTTLPPAPTSQRHEAEKDAVPRSHGTGRHSFSFGNGNSTFYGLLRPLISISSLMASNGTVKKYWRWILYHYWRWKSNKSVLNRPYRHRQRWNWGKCNGPGPRVPHLYLYVPEMPFLLIFLPYFAKKHVLLSGTDDNNRTENHFDKNL
jgi:hypothetical protein